MKERRLTVHMDSQPAYEIVYSDSFKGLAAEILALPKKYSGICVVTDDHVGPLYAEEVCSGLAETGLQPLLLTLPEGEEHKTLGTVEKIYRFLAEAHCDRHCLLVALGGGVIGDMTGFAAATYMRGIDYVQVPTTLLSQADSSIGGKTGVDLEGLKNMVGAFKMPVLVYENAAALKTLDARQYVAGFAEIMKHGLILDEKYYVWLLENLYEILDRDVETLREMLFMSNKIKRKVVEKDPYETGDRMLLNFGHTIGHAIEKNSGFSLLHGECVALGCVAAAYISYKRGILPMDEYYEIRDMFVPFGLPISIDGVDPETIYELTRSDKKKNGDSVRFVLLEGIGRAVVKDDVTREEILAAVGEVRYVEDCE